MKARLIPVAELLAWPNCVTTIVCPVSLRCPFKRGETNEAYQARAPKPRP